MSQVADLGYVDEGVRVKLCSSAFPLVVQVVLDHEMGAQARLTLSLNPLASKPLLPLRTTAVGQRGQLSTQSQNVRCLDSSKLCKKESIKHEFISITN